MGNAVRHTLGHMCGSQVTKEGQDNEGERPVKRGKEGKKKSKKSKKNKKLKNGELDAIKEEVEVPLEAGGNESTQPVPEVEDKKPDEPSEAPLEEKGDGNTDGTLHHPDESSTQPILTAKEDTDLPAQNEEVVVDISLNIPTSTTADESSDIDKEASTIVAAAESNNEANLDDASLVSCDEGLNDGLINGPFIVPVSPEVLGINYPDEVFAKAFGIHEDVAENANTFKKALHQFKDAIEGGENSSNFNELCQNYEELLKNDETGDEPNTTVNHSNLNDTIEAMKAAGLVLQQSIEDGKPVFEKCSKDAESIDAIECTKEKMLGDEIIAAGEFSTPGRYRRNMRELKKCEQQINSIELETNQILNCIESQLSSKLSVEPSEEIQEDVSPLEESLILPCEVNDQETMNISVILDDSSIPNELIETNNTLEVDISVSGEHISQCDEGAAPDEISSVGDDASDIEDKLVQRKFSEYDVIDLDTNSQPAMDNECEELIASVQRTPDSIENCNADEVFVNVHTSPDELSETSYTVKFDISATDEGADSSKEAVSVEDEDIHRKNSICEEIDLENNSPAAVETKSVEYVVSVQVSNEISNFMPLLDEDIVSQERFPVSVNNSDTGDVFVNTHSIPQVHTNESNNDFSLIPNIKTSEETQFTSIKEETQNARSDDEKIAVNISEDLHCEPESVLSANCEKSEIQFDLELNDGDSMKHEVVTDYEEIVMNSTDNLHSEPAFPSEDDGDYCQIEYNVEMPVDINVKNGPLNDGKIFVNISEDLHCEPESVLSADCEKSETQYNLELNDGDSMKHEVVTDYEEIVMNSTDNLHPEPAFPSEDDSGYCQIQYNIEMPVDDNIKDGPVNDEKIFVNISEELHSEPDSPPKVDVEKSEDQSKEILDTNDSVNIIPENSPNVLHLESNTELDIPEKLNCEPGSLHSIDLNDDNDIEAVVKIDEEVVVDVSEDLHCEPELLSEDDGECCEVKYKVEMYVDDIIKHVISNDEEMLVNTSEEMHSKLESLAETNNDGSIEIHCTEELHVDDDSIIISENDSNTLNLESSVGYDNVDNIASVIGSVGDELDGLNNYADTSSSLECSHAPEVQLGGSVDPEDQKENGTMIAVSLEDMIDTKITSSSKSDIRNSNNLEEDSVNLPLEEENESIVITETTTVITEDIDVMPNGDDNKFKVCESFKLDDDVSENDNSIKSNTSVTFNEHMPNSADEVILINESADADKRIPDLHTPEACISNPHMVSINGEYGENSGEGSTVDTSNENVLEVSIGEEHCENENISDYSKLNGDIGSFRQAEVLQETSHDEVGDKEFIPNNNPKTDAIETELSSKSYFPGELSLGAQENMSNGGQNICTTDLINGHINEQTDINLHATSPVYELSTNKAEVDAALIVLEEAISSNANVEDEFVDLLCTSLSRVLGEEKMRHDEKEDRSELQDEYDHDATEITPIDHAGDHHHLVRSWKQPKEEMTTETEHSIFVPVERVHSPNTFSHTIFFKSENNISKEIDERSPMKTEIMTVDVSMEKSHESIHSSGSAADDSDDEQVQTFVIKSIPENNGVIDKMSSSSESILSVESVDEDPSCTLDYGNYVFVDPTTGDIQVMRNRSKSLDSLVSMTSNRSSLSRFGSFEFVTDFEINIAEKNQELMKVNVN